MFEWWLQLLYLFIVEFCLYRSVSALVSFYIVKRVFILYSRMSIAKKKTSADISQTEAKEKKRKKWGKILFIWNRLTSKWVWDTKNVQNWPMHSQCADECFVILYFSHVISLDRTNDFMASYMIWRMQIKTRSLD